MLRVIAVGQRLDDELLVDATGLDRLELQEALREAVVNHILAVTPEGRYHFRHALLREVVDDDLLPGERAAIDLRLARGAGGARWSATARACTSRPRSRTTTPRPGTQPAALRASVRAADAAERVHAYGQAAHCSSARSRCSIACPTPRRWPAPTAPTILRPSGPRPRVRGRRAAPGGAGTRRARARRRARAAAPSRSAAGLAARGAVAARARGEESLATIEHALSLLPPGEMSHERADAARVTGQDADAARQARATRSRSRARRWRRPRCSTIEAVRGRALNALGTSLMALGEVEQGAAALREAVDLARAARASPDSRTPRYINLADASAPGGPAAGGARGDRRGAGARAAPGPRVAADPARPSSRSKPASGTRRATILRLDRRAPGRQHAGQSRSAASRAGARPRRARRAPALARRGRRASAAAMDEPQFTGVLGALTAELERREGDLDGARARRCRPRSTASRPAPTTRARLARVSAQRRHGRGRRRPARPRPRRARGRARGAGRGRRARARARGRGRPRAGRSRSRGMLAARR